MDKPNEIEPKLEHWRRVIGQTHTARLAQGAARLAADLDVPADVAAVVLGAAVDAERETMEQMLKEGRY